MNLVEASGIDVSGWAVNSEGQPIRTAPNRNPQYCYGWTFTNETTTVCCLWWEEMREDAVGIYTRLHVLEHQKIVPSGVRKLHTDDLAEALVTAHLRGAPIQVLVVSGERRSSPTDQNPSKVKFRQKDPTLWYVTEVDYEQGWIVIRRGGRLLKGVWHSPIALAQPLAQDADAIASDWKSIDLLDVPETEKLALRKARIGQGGFREALLARWGGKCALTGIAVKEALRASHCVPWAKADNAERLSPKNGLLLSATVDALFDAGLITFSEQGDLLSTPRAEDELHKITSARRLREELEEQEKAFLRRHRLEEFDKASRLKAIGFAS